MRSRFDIEIDKQLDMAWAKMDLQEKLFLTNTQYNDTVEEAFLAAGRIVGSLPVTPEEAEAARQANLAFEARCQKTLEKIKDDNLELERLLQIAKAMNNGEQQ